MWSLVIEAVCWRLFDCQLSASVLRLLTDDKAEFAVAIGERDQLAVIDILQGFVLATLENRAASAISPDGRWIASARHGRDDVEVFARADKWTKTDRLGRGPDDQYSTKSG